MLDFYLPTPDAHPLLYVGGLQWEDGDTNTAVGAGNQILQISFAALILRIFISQFIYDPNLQICIFAFHKLYPPYNIC